MDKGGSRYMLDFYLLMLDTAQQNIFITLWENYSERLLRRAYGYLGHKETAEEAVGDTFLSLMKHFSRYEDCSEDELLALLLTILDNTMRNHVKRSSRLKLIPLQRDDEPDFDLPDSESDPAEIAVSRMTVQRIMELLTQLPPIYREVLDLRLLHDCGYEEIAALLNITPETARKRFERGRRMILQSLSEERST